MLDTVSSSWALAVIFTIVATLSAELYLRLRYRNLLWMNIYPRVYVPDEELGYRYRAGAQGEIRIAGIHRCFHINRQGFHGHEFVESKEPGVFRIAFVGASNTTGIWVNGQGRNYVELLELELRREGYTVELLNFGIDGRFRALHQLRMLEKDVVRYRPDLVLLDVDIPFVYGLFRRDVYKGYVIIYNPEDPLSKQYCEYLVDRVVAHPILGFVYRASYIVRAACRYYMNRFTTTGSAYLRIFVENRIQAPDIRVLPCSLKKSVEGLQAAQEMLAKEGGKLVLMQYTQNPYYQYVAQKYQLPYVELNIPPTRHFIHDRDGHYRYEGHVEIARQLFIQLTEGGLLRSACKANERRQPSNLIAHARSRREEACDQPADQTAP